MEQQYDIYTSEPLRRLRYMNLFPRSRSNNYFDKTERLGLNELLSEAERELFQFQSVINKVPRLSLLVSRERDDLVRHIGLANSLTASIRQLPLEILREIFFHCATGTEIHCGECTRIPGLVLAHVCSYWRSAAFSTPELWTQIRIVSSSSGYHEYPGHTKLVEDILSYSLNRSLHICIVAKIRPTGPGRPAGPAPILHPAVSLLFTQAARWETFELVCKNRHTGSTMIDELVPLRGKLTSLRVFHCSEPRLGIEYSSLLGNALSLRSLTLSHFKFSHSVSWNQITDFAVTMSWNSEILQALDRMTNLNKLDVCMPIFIWRSDRNLGISPIFNRSLAHFHMQTKYICTHDVVENLLDGLTLPNLRSLEMRCGEGDRSKKPRLSGLPSLASFMQRSTPPLLRLSLTRIWISTEVLLNVLKSTPTLQSLQIVGPNHTPTPSTSMFTLEFFQNLHVCKAQIPLVPKLSLLEIDAKTLSIDLQEEFIKVIQCRDRTSGLRNDVERINSIGLKVRTGEIGDKIVESLMEFRTLGFLVSAESRGHGDIIARQLAQSSGSL